MDVKKLFEQDFEKLSKMSVREYTLYRGWEQIHNRKWSTSERQRMLEIKQNIWTPTDSQDYLSIYPVVVPADTKDRKLTWDILRFFISSAHWYSNPGRIKRFLVVNKHDMSFLGIISLGSDFMDLKHRDSYIGWSKKERMTTGLLKYTAMASTVVPTQPLGYNYVGGKLMALMACSEPVVNIWNKSYSSEELVGITTTSLYGGFSQYTGLKYWKKLGTSEGRVRLEPSYRVYYESREILKRLRPDFIRSCGNSGGSGPKSRPKVRILDFLYSKYKIKPPKNNAPRGVYWCNLYTDTLEFLRGKTDNPGVKVFDNSVSSLTDLWKSKYARKRIDNIIGKNKYNTDILFYDDMIDLTWNEAREKYLGEK